MPGLLLPPFRLAGGTAALAEPPYAFANTEAETLVAAMTVAPGTARKALIDTFIGALKAAGVWTKIDVMWVLAAHHEQAARLNWRAPGSFTLTNVNSVPFTTDRHFQPNGSTSYLDTGWDRATNGVQFTRDDAHIAVYQRDNSGNNTSFSDTRTGARVGVGGRPTAGGGSFLVNTSTLTNGPTTGTVPMHALARRNNSSQQSLVQDGVEVVGPTSANSGALETHDLAFGRYGHVYVSAQLAGGSVGAYFDDTEALANYIAWHDYMVAVGADT